MSDERSRNSGWDHSRWGRSERDQGSWDKSAWADASRELEEQEDAVPGRRGAAPDREVAEDRRAGQDRRASQGRRQPGQDRRPSRQSAHGADALSDLQRWLLRSGARSVRNEISGQVRRTFGGGRTKPADVWDTATNEIPPEVGQSAECQWCPICRAARRMRESGPGLGDHLSSAGDMVAAAVSEALKSVDSVLSRTTTAGSRSAPPDDWAAGDQSWQSARDSWAAAHGGRVEGPEADGDTVQAEAGPTEAGLTEAGQTGHEGRQQQTEGPDEPDNRG